MSDTFHLVPDFQICKNPIEEGYIAYSLKEDKYLFVPEDSSPALLKAFHDLKNNKLPQQVQKELAEQGWDLNIQDLQNLLYSRSLATFNGKFLDRSKTDARYVQGNDETFNLSRCLLKLEPKNRHPLPALNKILWWLIGITGIGFALSATLVFIIRNGYLLSELSNYNQMINMAFTKGIVVTALAIVLVLLSIIGHEWGHIKAAACYGISLRSIQWRLYRGVQGSVLVQLPGIPILPKNQQLLVALAGPAMNLWQAALYFLLWCSSSNETSFMAIWGMLFLLNSVMAISNLNPFYPTDGYKAISLILFKTVDIKSSMFAALKAKGFWQLEKRFKIYFFMYLISVLCIIFVCLQFATFLSTNFFGWLPNFYQHAINILLSVFFIVIQIYSTYKFIKKGIK